MDVQTGSWWDLAACRGRDATPFFAPSYFERPSEKLAREASAKALCSRCPIRERCLEHALAMREQHGVWGGLNEAERRAELRRRRSGVAG